MAARPEPDPEPGPGAAAGTGAPDPRELVVAVDTGARRPADPLVARLLVAVALAWSLFQLWYASPLPFATGILIVNDAEARSLHLAFAITLAFLAYPALRRSPRDRIPPTDWLLALTGAFCASYRFWFYDALAERPGLPTQLDIVVSVAGLVLLLEATRRSLGPPLMAVALVFLGYVFFGNQPWIPDVIRYQGASLARAMDQFWLSDQGVFGIAIGVSTKFVFLFVLFGALLDRAGAGNYFIKVAFSLLGHLRGGPAKAAVVASGLTGLISGSSIANTVTTGTFTIPLMKRVGFSSEKAGAVEVASSVNGQIMPPVMGAAAFLMVEYVGISYLEVIKHAVLPAVISYIALLYIVHLEALKQGMQGLERPAGHRRRPWPLRLALGGLTVASLVIVAGALYLTLTALKAALPGLAAPVAALGLVVLYVALVAYAARVPPLELDDPEAPMAALPEPGPTIKSGLHFLLPIAVLVWCLMVERLSPGLSAFWATVFMIGIIVTQRPLLALFRGERGHGAAALRGLAELFQGLVLGARNMVGIGVATAAAGIIVGTVGLTGIGLVMAQFVEFLSGGNLILILVLVALLSLILGMGLPTTANYIVVSALMAPVIVSLGAEAGLIVPLIAVHLFVFYFGIMADVTPPVGLASFAAAAVSGGDPIRTGANAFFYSLRTVALPFMFLFNTQLILFGIGHWLELVLTILSATLAMLVFAAATQGFLVVRSRLHESLLLLLVAFTLFRPGFWMDMIAPPTERLPGAAIERVVAEAPPGGSVRVVVSGVNLEGEEETKTLLLPLGPDGAPGERLRQAGMTVAVEGEGEQARAVVDWVDFFSGPAFEAGVTFGYEVEAVIVPTGAPPKELMFAPALLLLGAIVLLQRRRRGPGDAAAAARREREEGEASHAA